MPRSDARRSGTRSVVWIAVTAAVVASFSPVDGNATADTMGTIEGTVTLASGAPAEWLEAVQVEVTHQRGGAWRTAMVDPLTGRYSIGGLEPGTYGVRFATVEGDGVSEVNLRGEYFGDTSDVNAQRWVSVGAEPATGIDAELAVGRSVSGTVTLPDGADPSWIRGVRVGAAATDAGGGYSRVDPVTGRYFIGGLDQIPYLVAFDVVSYSDGTRTVRPDLVDEFYDDALDRESATRVDLSLVDATHVDATLTQGRKISGKVSIPAGADPDWMRGVAVGAFGTHGAIRNAVVDPHTGEYTITALPNDTFKLRFGVYQYRDGDGPFKPMPNLISEWYDDIFASEWAYSKAAVVDVRQGDRSGVDATLEKGTTISGRVTRPDGLPLGDSISVIAYAASDASGGEVQARSTVDENTGTYSISRIPRGDYHIRFVPSITSGLEPEYFGSSPDAAGATVVSTIEGDASAIDTVLDFTGGGMPPSPFADVQHDHPLYREICWLASAGISKGWDLGNGIKEYRPAAQINRDQMAAFLYRYAGSPEFAPPAISPFVDVPTNHVFYREISWLASTGISKGWDLGNGAREYRPAAQINRDQMAAFLYRYAGYPAFAAPSDSPFTDVSTEHVFYREISWLASTGISRGWDLGDGIKEYRPAAQINRDQMAAFLYRFFMTEQP